MTVRLSPYRFRRHTTDVGSRPPQSSDKTVTTPIDGFTDPMPEVVPPNTSDVLMAVFHSDQTGVGPASGVDDDAGNGAAGSDSRIALREVRRQRRRTTWLCAAVVAACLGLTIVVLSLARTRPAPPGTTVFFGSANSSITAPGSTPPPSDPHLGAQASEGGIR
jgi:hypothetical protein